MSDLRRWSEDGANDDELRLLAAHRERPNDAARKRTLVALGIGGAAVVSGGTASAGIGVMKILGAIVGTAIVGGAVVYFVGTSPSPPVTPPPPAASVNVSSSATIAAPLPDPTTPPAISASTKVAPSITVPPPKIASAPPPKPAASSSLAIEVKTLEDAQHALDAHDADGALRILDQYHARFPNGTLGGEETVLRVQALLARGERARATELANAYAAAHPDTPYARRIQALVKK